MEEIRELVIQAAARGRDPADKLAAFGTLVQRFQDMAFGYAYSILGDFHLAEDAAQDAFIIAFQRLKTLEDPDAFAGWLRRIVRTACRRLTRRKQLPTRRLVAAENESAATDEPVQRVAKMEMRNEIHRAIRQLPERQREVTTLFYINGYSQTHIADFLEVPVTTVKDRLHAARGRLKKRMLKMVSEELRSHSLPEDFRKRILEDAFLAADVDRVLVGCLPQRQELLRLPERQRPAGSERLFEFVSQRDDWLEILPDLQPADAAALLALVPRKKELLSTLLALVEKHPGIAAAKSRSGGWTLLHLTNIRMQGEEGRLFDRLLCALIQRGADVNARAGDVHAVTPLHNAAAVGNLSAMRILLEHGADVDPRAAGGATPLHTAAWYGQEEAYGLLVSRGADENARNESGRTPKALAAEREATVLFEEFLADRRFSAPAKSVLTLAKLEAERYRHQYVGSEHLLLGVVGSASGKLATLLIARSIDQGRARQAFEQRLLKGAGKSVWGLPLMPRAVKALHFAMERAGAGEVTPEDLLLALLQDGEAMSARLLRDLGVDLAELVRQLP